MLEQVTIYFLVQDNNKSPRKCYYLYLLNISYLLALLLNCIPNILLFIDNIVTQHANSKICLNCIKYNNIFIINHDTKLSIDIYHLRFDMFIEVYINMQIKIYAHLGNILQCRTMQTLETNSQISYFWTQCWECLHVLIKT